MGVGSCVHATANATQRGKVGVPGIEALSMAARTNTSLKHLYVQGVREVMQAMSVQSIPWRCMSFTLVPLPAAAVLCSLVPSGALDQHDFLHTYTTVFAFAHCSGGRASIELMLADRR